MRALLSAVVVAGLWQGAVSSGGGSIRGTVCIAQTAPPECVARAVVTLTERDGAVARSMFSGDDGRFEFDGLPKGSYTLRADKPGFLPGEAGALAPGRLGVALAVNGDVRLMPVQLWRGGVIDGRVTSLDGEAVSGATVHVLPIRRAPDDADPRKTVSVVSDDRGSYRVFGLFPGSYVVAVMTTERAAGGLAALDQGAIDTTFDLLKRGGAASGTPPVERAVGLAPIYYPGTPLASQATVLEVSAGTERTGVDVQVAALPAPAVTGAISDWRGSSAESLKLTLMRDGPGVEPDRDTTPPSPVVGKDGAFRFAALTPGHYTLLAHTASLEPGTRSGDAQRWAATEFDVGGNALSGLSLYLRDALTVTGRVTAESAVFKAPDRNKITVHLRPADFSGAVLISGDAQDADAVAPLRPDGTFQFSGLREGVYEMSVETGSANWHARSAVAGDVDLLDSGLRLTASVSGVAVELTDQRTTVHGHLRDGKGDPVFNLFIAAAPADPALRTSQRRFQVVRPDIDGEFTMPDLPAGEYRIAALSSDPSGHLEDPDFAAEIAAQGVPIVVREGLVTEQDLRIR